MKIITHKHPIDHKSSSITIALAQIEGPIPHGKHLTVLGSRQTFGWKSLEDMDSRIEKASGILDSLYQTSQKPHIVVFPEYALPVERAIPHLQRKADQYKQIIIAGADNIYDPKTNKIYNQCPILIPGRKRPLWVIKRDVSKWEYPYVDQPERPSIHILTWEIGGRDYWISIYTCLDFLLTPLNKVKGTGIFIVPMCSPEINAFRVYADTLLRAEAGTATILCNCVGELSSGQSSVMAVVPGAGPLKPAIELPSSKETVAVFEIDCRHLAPLKKEVPGIPPAVSAINIYALQKMPNGFKLIPSRSDSEDERRITRAVINPAIFGLLGKKMRIAFLEVDKYAEIPDKVKGKDFEVLAILGQHDLLITHLHDNPYGMIYDISQVIPLKNKTGTDLDIENFPYFTADVYFKVLGVPVEREERSIFHGPEKRVPTWEELAHILQLGNNWDDKDIPLEEREKFIKEREKFVKRKWILDRTSVQPGQISEIMTIFLDYGGVEATELHAKFEDRVLPDLINKPEVTSIYRGRAQSLSMHYILRISADHNTLYALIEEVHKLALQAKVLITTTTYIVMKKLSNLSLDRAVLLPVVPAEEANYRDNIILPNLSSEDRARVTYLPEDDQRAYIKNYRRIQESISDLIDLGGIHERISEVEKKLAVGLLHREFSILKEPHDLLQNKVEKLLTELIRKLVTDQNLDNWRGPLNIPPGKKKQTLTYTEKIRLAIRAIEEHKMNPELQTDLTHLNPTTTIRNAFAHGDLTVLNVEPYVNALESYGKFLTKWHKFTAELHERK